MTLIEWVLAENTAFRLGYNHFISLQIIVTQIFIFPYTARAGSGVMADHHRIQPIRKHFWGYLKRAKDQFEKIFYVTSLEIDKLHTWKKVCK